MSCSFEIAPIPGREAVQRNFAKLPEKSNSYSDRQLSLNERFSINERGYYLKVTERKSTSEEEARVVKLKPVVKMGSREELLCEMKLAADKKNEKHGAQNNESNHSTPVASPSRSLDSSTA